MNIYFEPNGDLAGFDSGIEKLMVDGEVKSILMLACEANYFSKKNLDPRLAALPVKIFGGIFPHIIYRDAVMDRGTLMIGLQDEVDVKVIDSLSNRKIDLDAVIEELIPETQHFHTMFILVDGFSDSTSKLLDSVFYDLGLSVNYLGGGVGALTHEGKPCLITNSGLHQDAAILVMSDVVSGVGSDHGWKCASEVFQITSAEHNVIKTINWEPAFRVYQRYVAQLTSKGLNRNNVDEIAPHYPIGIHRFGVKPVVRNIAKVTRDESLVLFGEIGTDSYGSVMMSTQSELLDASKSAWKEARREFPRASEAGVALVFEDVSCFRDVNTHRNSDFLTAVGYDVPVVGALTIGEIANNGKDYLEFYNKTSVVGLLT